MRTLASRIVALAVVVALATALVTTLAFARATSTQNAEDAQARAVSAVDAMVAALEARAAGEAVEPLAGLRASLTRRTGLVTVVARPANGYAARTPFTAADVAALRSGGTLPPTRVVDGTSYALAGAASGRFVVLAAQPVTGTARLTAAQWRRLLLTAVAGLVLGGLAGLVLARGVTRPLARVAEAARRMTGGDRTVRVPAEGPSEVADVATALDGLSDALARSESRQRMFLLAVSHELRTPLTSVAGYAEALADGSLALPGEVRSAAAVMRDEAARLQRRVEDLLALARLEADDFRVTLGPVDVASVLAAAASAFGPRAAAASVTLRVEGPSVGPVVTTDGERLRQIVDALADNALRVLPAGAPLVLASRAEGHGWVRVEVRDGGPGLSDADLAVAFERGVLTERYRGSRAVGSGLGLALVGELARRLGGRPVAERSPEGGVAFGVVLPTAP